MVGDWPQRTSKARVESRSRPLGSGTSGCRRVRAVRRNGNEIVSHYDALRFGEERNKHDGGENNGLQYYGYCQGAAAETVFAFALFGIALH